MTRHVFTKGSAETIEAAKKGGNSHLEQHGRDYFIKIGSLGGKVHGKKGTVKGSHPSEEHLQHQRDAMSLPEYRLKQSISKKELWKTEDFRLKTVIPYRKVMSSLEYMEKRIKGLNTEPNRPESIIIKLLDKLFPNEWKYVGGHSRADFKHNNSNSVILHNGRYWHPNPIEEFFQVSYFYFKGYNCLVIWEEEVNNEELMKKKIIKWYNRIGLKLSLQKNDNMMLPKRIGISEASVTERLGRKDPTARALKRGIQTSLEQPHVVIQADQSALRNSVAVVSFKCEITP